ncbi:MAG: DUF4395 domain-containing protein [Actinomycetota bacterium]
MPGLFSFPNPVNETSARIVAGGAVAMSVAFVLTGNGWVLAALTYGFIARVLTGPTLSPLGRLATQVLTPRIRAQHRFVPGPPKRFAQGIGAAMSSVASVLYVQDAVTAARVVIAGLAIAAFLEAAFALCLGCKIFSVLMRIGVIPASVCEECNDISSRLRATSEDQVQTV